MAAPVAEHFAGIIAAAHAALDQVEATVDATSERAILRVQAGYGLHRVFIVELLSTQARKYRYYVLRGDFVVAGFDNSADPRAIRLKYGRIDTTTTAQLVPHVHLNDKSELLLTEEMSFDAFISWLKEHVPRDSAPSIQRGDS